MLNPPVLQATEESLLFDRHPLASIIISTCDHIIERSNKAAGLLFGKEALTGLVSFLSFVPQAQRHLVVQWLSAPATSAPIFTLVTASTTHQVQLYAASLPGGRQVITLIDVTAQKEAEEKNRFLASLLDETADCLTAADLEFKPITWNRSAERLFGVTAAEAIGHNLRDYLNIEYSHATAVEVREEIAAKGVWRGEMYFNRKGDGKKIILYTSFKRWHNADGTPVAHVISCTDITSLREAEQRVAEMKNHFQALADAAPVGIWMNDAEGKLSFVSKPLLQYSEIDHLSIEQIDWNELIHPEDREGTRKKYYDEWEGRKNINLVYRAKKGDGWAWVQDTAVPRFAPDGSFQGYLGSVTDIDKQKAQADKLHYQSTILENVQDLVVTTDTAFNLKTFNKIAFKYYGISLRKGIGRPIGTLINFNFLHTTHQAALDELLQKGRWEGEVSVTLKDESVCYLRQTVTYMRDHQGTHIGFIAVGHDITQQKIAEQSLVKSEKFYRTLIGDSLDGVLVVSEEGIIKYLAPSIERILGHLPEEGFGRSLFEFVHPDDLPVAISAFSNEVTKTSEVKFVDIRLRSKTEGWVWCSVRGQNMLRHPNINGIRIYFHNITQRRLSEEALRESERRFRNLIADLQLGVVIYENNGNVLLCNQAAQVMLELSEADLYRRDATDTRWDVLNDDEEIVTVDQYPFFTALQTKTAIQDVLLGVYRAKKSDRVWLLVNAAPVLDENNEVKQVVCTFTDVSEQRRLKKEQVDQQKSLTQATIDGQEAERRYIGKELHDNIGQQLTTAKLYLDMARSTADAGTAAIIDRAMQTQLKIINEVRSMSRLLTPPTLGDLGLIEAIKDLMETFTITQGLRFKLECKGFDHKGLPENEQLMLFRIVQEGLNNIVKHAGASQVLIALRQTLDATVLRITDDGKGFDTAAVRQGSGLANMKNRVALFNGSLQIKTTVGKGCSLQISVPTVPQVKEPNN